ncbi:MAG: VOC family protein [Pseudomonadota bacterium]
MEDIFVPKTSGADALVKQLHTVTYVTAEPERVTQILVEGFGLSPVESLPQGSSHPDAASRHLGFSSQDAWGATIFRKIGEGENVQVRLLSVEPQQAQVRRDHSGRDLGAVTLSFPMRDLVAHEQSMQHLDVASTIGVKEMEFASPDGQTYISAEILYKAPENVLLLGVRRPEQFVPVGPIDPATGLGGPAYSARCVANPDKLLEVLQGVMGFEIRRDAVFTIGERSGLLLPEGTQERFIQAFAPGAATGYLILMDHFDVARKPAASTAPPNRGLVMWSFETSDLDEVVRRAEALGLTILSPPGQRNSPGLPIGRTAVVEDSEGFPLEFFER